MTYPISDVTRRVVYSGSAGTGPYTFTFEVLTQGDIGVYKNSTLLALTTDYTVTINVDGTGYVTLVSAATAADTIAIFGNKGIQRSTDFVTGGDLFANSLNDELDAQTIFAQQNAEAIVRSIRAPQFDPTGLEMTLPAQASRANRFPYFNATGETAVTSFTYNDMLNFVSALAAYNFTAASISSSRFTGDGATLIFTLPLSVYQNSCFVYINGAHQQNNTYTISGTTLTFSEAPPLNADIEVTIFGETNIGSTTASQVGIVDTGTYYSSSDVEGALAQIGATGITTSLSVASGGTNIGTSQSLTAAGAVDLTSLVTFVDSTAGAMAITLADGTDGQVKNLVMVADGGDATLTPANFGNGTDITFGDAGDSCVLAFDGTEWWVVSNNGCTIS